MGEVTHKSSKPLQVNPIKLSQPMGATLAFLGVDGCMPLMHGGQGCTSLTKVYYTRHFSEPIAIQTSAVTDAIAVLDGGDYSIVESVKNITRKVSPSLIGLYTTGLPETKGDDIRAVATKVDYPLVYANTPDYEGGLESGWAATCKALIDQLVEPAEKVNDNKLVLLPNVSLQPIEVEKIKDLIEGFGFNVLALPDLSTSLDGHLGEKQASLSCGGISVDEIRGLADAGLVVSVGDSMQACAVALQKKNPHIRHQHFSHLQGLEASDELIEILLAETGFTRPHPGVIRWRKRLQDAMLDSHFSLGQTRFLVAAEPDQLAGICQSLYEAGGKVTVAISPVDSPQLNKVRAEKVLVGDLEDAERLADDFDLVVGNFHCEALAHRLHKGLVLRGFPIWEQVGNQLKNDLLYEGGAYFLFECANAATLMREHQAS
ncbi:MAG TPA: nitrogenase iron-molybdenum cofactor biosynthesis protein NifN [Geopsychrobacteraceae bacterium]|nr:nitrogenase iron-molybdenum cofactor biosynthesis protein NifN [Geopsychrobacteraceae bacterium]